MNGDILEAVSGASSSEIKDEYVEGGSIITCRICFQSDSNEDDDLISPCLCKGTQQFVHRSCLDHSRSVMEGFAFSHCTTCKTQFHLRVVEFEENSWRKIKFKLFVARDVFLVFLVVQTVIGILGGLAYLADKNGSFRNSFNQSWERILSTHPIPFYYCIGVLILLMLLGILWIIQLWYSAGCEKCWTCFLIYSPISGEPCVILVLVLLVIFGIGISCGFFAATMAIQRIWQRHYHILTKRQLTKDYIVEDLHGCSTRVELDPVHTKRLKKLKLL